MVTFDFNKTPITQIADAIIIDASNRGASDIHLDPRENGIMTRIRVDGDLVDYAYIPKMYERNLTTRLKLMSNMNITENRLPQDGAIKGKFGDKDLDMRVSCLPTNEGEKIVIRILDYSRSLSGLDKLGFNQENYQKLLRMIGNPNGIILITGATGSGKSTTVYSILQALNKEETNIITVEDPIEMNIEGMNQVQVNSEIGLDFAVVLRSILRQDPNVILIGEIRDSETAQIAVRASITGHLVLSTIHTNNSLSTIERLLDMNVERYLLSSALTGIISQRLAKMLCPKCRLKRKTTPYEKKVFKLAMKKDVEEIYDANHNGCDFCHKGYRGRIAVQEVLEITEHIKSTINSSTTDNDKLRQLVYGSGNVITLLQDGLGKVLNGFTTFEEIYRIIEIDNDIEDSCLSDNIHKEEKKENVDKKEETSSMVAIPTENKQEVKTSTSISSLPSEMAQQKKELNTVKTQGASSILGNRDAITKAATPPIVNPNQEAIKAPVQTIENNNEKNSSPISKTNINTQKTKIETPIMPEKKEEAKTPTTNTTPIVNLNQKAIKTPVQTIGNNNEKSSSPIPKPNVNTQKENKVDEAKSINTSLLPNLDFNHSMKENKEKSLQTINQNDVNNTKKGTEIKNSNSVLAQLKNQDNTATNKKFPQPDVKVPLIPVIDSNKKLEVPLEKTVNENKTSTASQEKILNNNVISNKPPIPITSAKPPLSTVQATTQNTSAATTSNNIVLNTKQNSSPIHSNEKQLIQNKIQPTTKVSPSTEQINNFFNNNLNSSQKNTSSTGRGSSQITINNQIPIASSPKANNSNNTITNKPNINNLIFPQNTNKN